MKSKGEKFHVLNADEAGEFISKLANLNQVSGGAALSAGLPGVTPPPKYSHHPALWRSDELLKWCKANREALASMPPRVAVGKTLP